MWDGDGERKVEASLVITGRALETPADASGGGGLGHARGRASVEEILDVDGEYRRKAAAGVLRMIRPRRLNPERRAWLPVLHTERGARRYTALFSNTERAHELRRTHDWVVIYGEDGGREDQATVVTEWRGVLAGRRVVRGREAECRRLYAALDPTAYARACRRAHIAPPRARRPCPRYDDSRGVP